MKTIIWDVDDVLNSLMLEWFAFYKKNISSHLNISFKHIKQNPPHKILSIQKNEYFKSLDQFRNSENGKDLKPNRKILDWLQNEGENFRHIALTARPLCTIPVLSEWLFKHFGNWIRMFAFVPSFRDWEEAAKYDGTKGDFLKWLNKADFFIDDNQDNVKIAEEIGIKSFLYPQPWNDGKAPAEDILTEITNSKD